MGFYPKGDGQVGIAEADGNVHAGDIVLLMNGRDVQGMEFTDILKCCTDFPRPLTMRFGPGGGEKSEEPKRRASWKSGLRNLRKRTASVNLSSVSMNVARVTRGARQELSALSARAERGYESFDQLSETAVASSSRGMKWVKGLAKSAYGSDSCSSAAAKEAQRVAGTEIHDLLPQLRLESSSAVDDGKGLGEGGEGSAAGGDGKEEEEGGGAVAVHRHTGIIVAKAGERMIGGSGDENFVGMTWHRAMEGGNFEEIAGVTGGFYQPSADDIGARICVKVVPLTPWLAVSVVDDEEADSGGPEVATDGDANDAGEANGTSAKGEIRSSPPSQAGTADAGAPTDAGGVDVPLPSFAEFGPLTADEAVSAPVSAALKSGKALFAGLRRSRHRGATFQIEVNADTGVRVVRNTIGGGGDSRTEAEVGFSRHLRVCLHAARPVLFTLMMPAEGGGDGDGVDGSEVPTNWTRFDFSADSASTRDIIALVIRKMRNQSIGGVDVQDGPPPAAAIVVQIVDGGANQVGDGDEDTPDGKDDDDLVFDTATFDESLDAESSAADLAKVVVRDEVGGGHVAGECDAGEGAESEENSRKSQSSANEDSRSSICEEGGDNDNDSNERSQLVASVSAELEACKTKLALERKTAAGLRRRAESLSASLSKTTDSLAAKSAEVAELCDIMEAGEEARQQAATEVDLVSTERTQLRKAKRALEVALADTERSLKERQGEAETAKRSTEDALRAVKQKEAECNDRTVAMETAQAEAKRTTEELVAARADIAEKELALAAAEQATSDARAESAERLVGAKAAEQRLEEVQSTVARLEESASTLREELETQTKELRCVECDRDVLKASVEVRDGKVSTLEQRVETLSGQLTQVSEEAANARIQAREIALLEAQQAKSAVELTKITASTEEAECARDEALGRLAAAEEGRSEAEARATAGEALAAQRQDEIEKMVGQRNSLKRKAESLARDLSRLMGDDNSFQDVERMVSQFDQLQVQLSIARAEKQEACDELEEYKNALDEANRMRNNPRKRRDAEQALRKHAELQRIIADLTEANNDKELALQSQRETNALLADRLQELEHQVGEGPK